ncbi:MAG: hypothetical protein RL358_1291 [Pseudomonadota bacterium]|jgi:hypothetical protein
MPVELTFPFVILAFALVIWFVGSHADVPSNRKEHPAQKGKKHA